MVIVKIKLQSLDDDILGLFTWCVANEDSNGYTVIGEIDDSKETNISKYIVSKYIEQKVNNS